MKVRFSVGATIPSGSRDAYATLSRGGDGGGDGGEEEFGRTEA